MDIILLFRSLYDLIVYGGETVKTNLQGKSEAVSIDSLLDALFRVHHFLIENNCNMKEMLNVKSKWNMDNFDHFPSPFFVCFFPSEYRCYGREFFWRDGGFNGVCF